MKGEILPPLAATLHVKAAGRSFRLWLPLFLVWLILLCLLILALPFLLVAALIAGVKFWRSLAALARLLAATRGSHVEVDNPETKIEFRLH